MRKEGEGVLEKGKVGEGKGWSETEWLNDWMIEWLNDWMIEWLNDWMIEWLNNDWIMIE